jgi:2-polyprenyl-6-methoxyphenol hydroxylase-like FAD-dependent oxidoreductase
VNRTEESVDVLVAGAGPVGLSLASELVRHGVRCRIVEMNAGPSLWSKAAIIHARTLEAMNAMGLAEDVIASGRKVHGLAFYSGDQRIGEVAVDNLDSPYPFMLGLSQRETELHLEQHLGRLGGKVERRVELASVRLGEDGVTATLRHDDGRREVVTTSYLCGCDGAHSVVRKSLEIPFEGSTYEEAVLQADVRIRWPFPVREDEALFFASARGALGALPVLTEGRYRLMVLLGPEQVYDPTLENFRLLMEERGPAGAVVEDPAWMTAFRFHHRMVPRYRTGRVFLAGDAAHVQSPVGGQGMNMGIQDAFNLAWKLALAIRGRARPAVLDSYHAERWPIAAATLGATDVATRFGARAMGLRSGIAQRLRDELFGLAGRLPMIEARAAALMGGLGADYRSSPIVGQHVAPLWPNSSPLSLIDRASFEEGPGPGQRVGDVDLAAPWEGKSSLHELLHGTTHTLLLLTGHGENAEEPQALARIARAATAAYGDLVHAFLVTAGERALDDVPSQTPLLDDRGGAVHRRLGARAGCLYLVRPDGYVAYRSQPADLDKLLGYLAGIFIG